MGVEMIPDGATMRISLVSLINKFATGSTATNCG